MSFLRRLRLGKNGGPRHARAGRPSTGFRPRLEPLEDRRLLKAGVLDPTFGTGGVAPMVRFPIVSSDYGEATAIDHQGRVIVAGYTGDDIKYEFAVARYSASGALDTSFGGTGTVHFSMGATDAVALGVAVDSMNRVVVAGYASKAGYDFAVARLTAAGVLDSSFGTGGKQLIDFGGSDRARGVAVDSLDRIIVAGLKNSDFAVARLTTAGVLDSSFGAGGKVTIDFGGSTDLAYGVTIDPIGRVVVCGSAKIGTNTNFAVARLTTRRRAGYQFWSRRQSHDRFRRGRRRGGRRRHRFPGAGRPRRLGQGRIQ